MAQLEVIQSNWGKFLLATPDVGEIFAPQALNRSDEEWQQLLLWPVQKGSVTAENTKQPRDLATSPAPSDAEPLRKIRLLYRISGLVSLAEVRCLPTFNLENDLKMTAALCYRLDFLENYLATTSIAVDEQHIYLPCTAKGEPLWQEPLFLFLPFINRSTTEQQKENNTTGLLAEVSEPLIRLAQTDERLPEEIKDRLLIQSWESPLLFLESLLQALEYLTPDNSISSEINTTGKGLDEQVLSQAFDLDPVTDRQSPGRQVSARKSEEATASSGNSKKQNKKQAKTNKEKHSRGQPLFKKNRLILILFLQLPLLLGAFHLTQGTPKNSLSYGGFILLFAVFFSLDLWLLFHKKSPLRTAANTGSEGKPAMPSQPENTAGADFLQVFKEAELNKQKISPEVTSTACKPTAKLLPERLLYRENNSDDARAQACFQPATIADLYFAIGKDMGAVDLCLNTAEVAPLQAEIIYDGRAHHLRCCRAAATAGEKKPGLPQETRLNGLALEPFSDHSLTDGDLLSFGRYLYRFICY